ncbi:MAG: prepilin-type N-terminal cleavage/methylation domain-containing protein [Mobilitalea sp.]
MMKSMNNDRGFTLIELIIVILIMALLGVGSMTGFNLLNTSSAEKTADRIKAVLDYIQMENMTKTKAYTMKIENIADDYKLSIISTNTAGTEVIESTEILELDNGTIIFENNIDLVQILVSSVPVAGWQVADKLVVGFRKDTGGVKEYATDHYVTRIGFIASGRTYYLRIVTATGKHYIE